MKRLKQKLIGATLAVVALMLALFSHTALAVGSVAVSTDNLSVAYGGTGTFSIAATNAAGRVDIASSDTDIATISDTSIFLDSGIANEGVKTITVTGAGVGTATITVTLTDVVTFDEEQLSSSTTYTVDVVVGPSIAEDAQLEFVADNILLLNSGDFGDVEDRVEAGDSATISHLRGDGSEADNDTVITGDKLRITISGVNFDYTLAFLGDVNRDGSINSADYIKIKKHIMETETIDEGSAIWFAADITKDDQVTSGDYVKVRLYIMDGTGEWRP